MGMIKQNNASPGLTENTLSAVKQSKKALGEKLTRNVLVAALLLCCVVGARDMALPGEQSVIDVLQTAVRSEWDENLGRLVYVNGTVSDAIAVFSSAQQPSLYPPSKGKVSDIFSKDSPYIMYADAGSVYAAAGGEVLSITKNADNDTCCIRILSKDAIECLYYGLRSCQVSEGEEVQAMTVLGDCMTGTLTFEVRRRGEAVDASAMFLQQKKE